MTRARAHAPLARAAAALLAAIALVGACTGETGSGGSGGPPAPGPSGAASASPSLPAFSLDLDLRSVQGEGVVGRLRPRELRGPADAVARTISDLYTIGFVDPADWADGEFRGLAALFAGDARKEVSRDLQSLTLGRVARRLDAVRPRRARLDVDFLADRQDRALVAVADVLFKGVGLDGETTTPIRHEGTYTLRRSNGRWRIVAYDVRARAIGPAKEAELLPAFPSREPRFVLVIGSDARPGQSVTATRADSLHIVGVNPRKGRASVLGIPRDSWVPIPGGGSDKINAALVRGGPDLVVQTVERLTGIPIDAYVLTGFEGFRDVLGAVGGIDIRIPFPISDVLAQAHFKKGPAHLSGHEALAFSRARHDLPDGDFGRSLNQGRVLVATLATLRASFLDRGGAAVLPWAAAGARYLVSDLSLSDMVDLLLAAPAFDPRRVRNEVVPGRVGTVGDRSVVFLGGLAQAKFRDLGRDGLLGS